MPYSHVQLIAFNIKPATEAGQNPEKYLGDEDTDKDIGKRCTIMKHAIRTAHEWASRLARKTVHAARRALNNIAEDHVLKVFMAPEFYFRGVDGAYPVERVPKILETLREETGDDKYGDWLFVFGTAIGYLKHGQTLTKVTAVEDLPPGGTRITVDSLSGNDWSNARAHPYRQAQVMNVARPAGNDWKLTLDADQLSAGKDRVRFVHGPDATVSRLFNVKASALEAIGEPPAPTKAAITIENPGGQIPCPECGCDRFRPRRNSGTCKKCNHTHALPIAPAWTAELLGSDPIPSVTGDAPVAFDLQVTAVEDLGQGNTRFTVNQQVQAPVGNAVELSSPGPGAKPWKFTIQASTADNPTKITVRNPARVNPCPACNCRQFRPPAEGEQSLCADCDHPHTVPVDVGWEAKIRLRQLTLNKRYACSVGDLVCLTRYAGAGPVKEAEVFNVALVQRGGPDPGRQVEGAGELDPGRELIVFKEFVSHIDYLKTNQDWSQRKIRMAGDTDVTVVPTEGSADQLSKQLNQAWAQHSYKGSDGAQKVSTFSEMSKSGLGGGCVFKMDDIVFGLEICLDHAQARLDAFYRNPAAVGTSKPQIHLIPSWGMTIQGGPMCCVADGLAFNVDGQVGDSEALVNDGDYSCKVHPNRTAAVEEYCPDCMWWACPVCGSTYQSAITGLAAARSCPNPACGGANLISFYYCVSPNCHGFAPGNVPCPDCGGPMAPWEKKLQRGVPVGPMSDDTKTVKLSGVDWWKVTQENYFKEKGHIRIYKEMTIPALLGNPPQPPA